MKRNMLERWYDIRLKYFFILFLILSMSCFIYSIPTFGENSISYYRDNHSESLSIVANEASILPTIDGVISGGEWDEVEIYNYTWGNNEQNITNGNFSLTLGIKYNSTHLFFLFKLSRYKMNIYPIINSSFSLGIDRSNHNETVIGIGFGSNHSLMVTGTAEPFEHTWWEPKGKYGLIVTSEGEGIIELSFPFKDYHFSKTGFGLNIQYLEYKEPHRYDEPFNSSEWKDLISCGISFTRFDNYTEYIDVYFAEEVDEKQNVTTQDDCQLFLMGGISVFMVAGVGIFYVRQKKRRSNANNLNEERESL